MAHVTATVGARLGGWRRAAKVFRLCFMEARPAVQGIFLLRFLAGASFSGPLFFEGVSYSLLAGAGLWICVTLSVYILNGVMDVEEDQINGSSRPVASGKLKVVQAASVAGGLAILSIVGGFALGSLMMCSVIVALVLGWLYSGPPLYLKRWSTGSAGVAILAALITYNAGHAANGGGGNTSSLFVFATIMALWMGLVGQTKDLSDIEGDKQAGRKSGPVVWGEDTARIVFSGVALFLGGGYIVFAVFFTSNLLVPACVLALGAMVVAVTTLGPWSRGDNSRRRRPYQAFMLTQYAATVAVLI